MYLPYKFKKLDLAFDLDLLLRDLGSIADDWWTTHHFDGTSHDVVLLISHEGRLRNADGSENHSLLPPFEPTEYLRELPYFAEVLDAFGTPPSRSRLMRVAAGESVKAHQDSNPHWNNKVRIHIPIITDPAVGFHVWSESPNLREADHELVHMQRGEAWVFNGWYQHAVSNDAGRPRVHLVGDFPAEGEMYDLLFGDCSDAQMADVESFEYPEYEVAPEHATWAAS